MAATLLRSARRLSAQLLRCSQQRRSYGVLDTPEEKSVYPSLKRLVEAAKSVTSSGKKEKAAEKDQPIKAADDAEAVEPSNRLLEAAQRFDEDYRKTAEQNAALVAAATRDSVQSGVFEAAQSAALVQPSAPSSWLTANLNSDPARKFAFLTDCSRRFARSIPNSRLAELATVGDALNFFAQPAEPSKDPLKRLAAAGDLPANVHVQVEPLRYTDNPEFFGGVDAFPGRDTLVTQPWARAKHRSKIAPPLRTPRWTGVGRNPVSISESFSGGRDGM